MKTTAILEEYIEANRLLIESHRKLLEENEKLKDQIQEYDKRIHKLNRHDDCKATDELVEVDSR